MKAFIIDRYKPSDGGRIADVPEPVPADGQVLVEIHAAGLNLPDFKIRSGGREVRPVLCHERRGRPRGL